MNKRYTLSDMVNMRFYKMPKFLFTAEYDKLSNNAKMLYMLLLDRLDLSIKNNWINENGEVYIIYSRSEMGEELRLSRPTITSSMKSLIESGLLQEELMSIGKSNRIYLMTADIENSSPARVTSLFSN